MERCAKEGVEAEEESSSVHLVPKRWGLLRLGLITTR